jgi:glutaconate CoA-transferase subunit B
MFNYWIGAGRIQVAFLGAAQVDRHANLNSTVIGDYEQPKVRLPGAGGAPEIARCCREILVVVRQSPRAFVEELDFRSSSGERVSAVITDLGILEPDPETRELVLTHLQPGATVDEATAATGWPLRIADDVAVVAAPTDDELAALRALEVA